MEKIKFAIIGSGWRSRFFIRIALVLKDQFEISSMLFRTEEKAELFAREYGIPCTCSREEFLASDPHFIVTAVGKSDINSLTREYLEMGFPVLMETPAGMTRDELNTLWAAAERGARIQVAEQYQFYPEYEAMINEALSGHLGTLQNVYNSCVHGYHGASLSRLLLDLTHESFSVAGRSYLNSILETDSRDGLVTDGRLAEKETAVLTLDFEGGKTVFHRFSGVQYHSLIRSKHLFVQGERGEMEDLHVRYMDTQNRLVEKTLPFENTPGLTGDETAIARCLKGMKTFIDTGKEFYPLSSALQDAYISLLMDEALKTGQVIQSELCPWN